ncbi:hypothetical protein E3U43_003271, partial [Larimichthys crocea]
MGTTQHFTNGCVVPVQAPVDSVYSMNMNSLTAAAHGWLAPWGSYTFHIGSSSKLNSHHGFPLQLVKAKPFVSSHPITKKSEPQCTGKTNGGWHSKDNLKDLRAIIRTEWQQGHLAEG